MRMSEMRWNPSDPRGNEGDAAGLCGESRIPIPAQGQYLNPPNLQQPAQRTLMVLSAPLVTRTFCPDNHCA